MDKLQVTKNIVAYVVGAGASQIVKTIIKNNVDSEKTLEKIEIVSASIVIGLMAKDGTKKYTDAKIDKWAQKFQDLKAKANQVQIDEEVPTTTE